MRALAAGIVVVVALVVALAVSCADHVDEQRLPIGSPCNTSGQCGLGRFFCDTAHPNGYCKASCARDADCPAGSVCVGAGMILAGACEKTCPDGVTDCRAGDVCTPAGDQASAPTCDAPAIVDGGGSD